MLDKLLSFIAPHYCYGCDEIGSSLCLRCKSYIINSNFTTCILCGGTAPHGVCPDHDSSIAQAWVVGRREFTLERAINALKFQHVKGLGKELAELLATRLPKNLERVIWVPIPTAASHVRERGYDQALLLARHLASQGARPLERLLARRHSLVQHVADRHARREQAATAFVVSGAVDSKSHYVLIDDIVTTGSTLEAAARVLREAGARRVSVLALAYQPLD